MLAGMIRERGRVTRRRWVSLGLAALIAVIMAAAPVWLDSSLDTSLVPAASACCGQSGGGG